MTKTDKPTNRKTKTFVRNLEGNAWLEAEVSPCVFMYPGYPFQLTVTLRGCLGQYLGEVHPADRTRTASTYTDADAERLLAGVQFTPCSRCSTPAFDPTTVETNRGGLCETCFLADFRAELEREEEAERQKLAARDFRMKNNGMTVRGTAWVHPDNGDDYQLTWYLKEKPLPEQITVALLEEGSTVLDDFEIIQL